MLDPAHPVTSGWLWTCVLGFALFFGLPLTLAPLAWARRFGWRVPDKDHELAVYFGRCLGAVVLVLGYFVARAAPTPARDHWALELFTFAGAAMTLVHGWGWLRRMQPRSENVETIGYALVTIVNVWISATLP